MVLQGGARVLLWAAISGALFVLGVGPHAWIVGARLAALIAEAISPKRFTPGVDSSDPRWLPA